MADALVESLAALARWWDEPDIHLASCVLAESIVPNALPREARHFDVLDRERLRHVHETTTPAAYSGGRVARGERFIRSVEVVRQVARVVEVRQHRYVSGNGALDNRRGISVCLAR